MSQVKILQRKLELLKIKLKSKTKASKTDPNDLVLQSAIIQIEGKFEKVELEIQYAKEDEESKAAREEVNIEQCEPTWGPGETWRHHRNPQTMK